MSDDNKKLKTAVADPLQANRDPNKQQWVKFEEDDKSVDGEVINLRCAAIIHTINDSRSIFLILFS